MLQEQTLGILHVADRGIPAGPVLVPLLSVATDADLFDDGEGDFDLLQPSGDDLVAAFTGMISGAATAAERRGDAHFTVRRSLLTL